jgi:hypothetical protein
MVQLAAMYTNFLGCIFAIIAFVMLVAPGINLAQDGISFDSFTIAGKAEVRAYYVGTALCISWMCITSKVNVGLQAIAIVLGGFASSRLVTYYLDGVDPDPAFS